MMKPQKAKRHIRFFTRVIIVLIASLVFSGAGRQSACGMELLLGTDALKTFSHFMGRRISGIINREVEGLTCKAVPTPDAVYMLTNLRSGSMDLVLVDSRTLYDAFHQKGRFQYMDIRYDTLRMLFPLYAVPLTLIVRKDAAIDALNDLKDKRINIGSPGSPRRAAMNLLFAAKGWTRQDFSLVGELPHSQGQDTMAFCQGEIQAMVTVGVHPDPSLQQLLQLCKSRLIPMDDPDIEKLVEAHPAYSKMRIAAATYSGQSEAVETFGTQGMLVVSEDLDESIVFRLLEAIGRNYERLKSVHPALFPVPLDETWKNPMEIPRHPGAIRYVSPPR